MERTGRGKEWAVESKLLIHTPCQLNDIYISGSHLPADSVSDVPRS